jgi:hypothetical protein
MSAIYVYSQPKLIIHMPAFALKVIPYPTNPVQV